MEAHPFEVPPSFLFVAACLFPILISRFPNPPFSISHFSNLLSPFSTPAFPRIKTCFYLPKRLLPTSYRHALVEQEH